MVFLYTCHRNLELTRMQELDQPKPVGQIRIAEQVIEVVASGRSHGRLKAQQIAHCESWIRR